MLENTITLALPNGGTPVNVLYRKIDTVGNKSTYKGPDATSLKRQEMSFARVPVKRSGKFLGTQKGDVKFTNDITVPNSVGEDTVYPLVLALSASCPVGVTVADVDKSLDHVEALIKTSGGFRAYVKRLIFDQEI